MKTRPILFSGPMVRAILDGRKTQTRRVVKPQGAILTDAMARAFGVRPPEVENSPVVKCPYGPGDRLWVRENCWIAQPYFADPSPTDLFDDLGRRRVVGYSANMDGDAVRCAKDYGVKQSPSIFMPRWASRITIEITGVRVERLQAISEEDAKAEGVEAKQWYQTRPRPFALTYFDLWDQINGINSHKENPWVWVIEFKKI